MKINKSSWHYKVWESSYSNSCFAPDETNLCDYFSKVVSRLLVYTLFFMFIISAIIFLGYNFITFAITEPQKAVFVLEFITLSVIIGIVLAKLIDWYCDPKPSNNLFAKWYRAKKEKICPLIEFEE